MPNFAGGWAWAAAVTALRLRRKSHSFSHCVMCPLESLLCTDANFIPDTGRSRAVLAMHLKHPHPTPPHRV